MVSDHNDVSNIVIRDVSSLLQRKSFNEVLYLTMTKEVDNKIFSKVAYLTVERVKRREKLTTAESPKLCE